jgi:hypothetical protein
MLSARHGGTGLKPALSRLKQEHFIVQGQPALKSYFNLPAAKKIKECCLIILISTFRDFWI